MSFIGNTARGRAGFSMPEVMIVVGIIALTAAVAIPGFISLLPASRANGAARTLFVDLQLARMQSISENNNYVVTFSTADNSYSIYNDADNDFATAGIDTSELVKSVTLTDNFTGIQLGYVSSTNPDGASITGAVSFPGTPPSVTFMPEGLAQSGYVFIKPTEDSSRTDRQRAIGVRPSGRIKLYTHNGGWD
jgi:prepilin-type N-terminal cleavage/methylation domain-containing protein